MQGRTFVSAAVEAFDAQWMNAVGAMHSDSMTQAMLRLHTAHDAVLAATVAALLVVFAVRRHWRHAVLLVAIVPGGMLANVLAKQVFQRPRPGLHALIGAHGYGFPSGHTVAATLLAGFLALLVFRLTRAWIWRAFAIAAGAATVGAVAFSRVYLGAHYPADVIAAILAGTCWTGLCIVISDRVPTQRSRGPGRDRARSQGPGPSVRA